MKAAWYDRRGAATEVLVVGRMDDPMPGPGDVRIRVRASGINPGETGKRSGAAAAMPFPRVIPHSDGAGVIDAVGPSVPQNRVDERVWCFGAQSYRPFGTAAELVVVPAWQAVPLPERVSFEQGACLGIPGITAHRAVFADGPVTDKIVLVVGAAGAVGSMATAFACWGGARVLALVRHERDTDLARKAGAEQVFLATHPDLTSRIRVAAPDGVNRIIDIAFATYAQLYADIIGQGGVIATYSSSHPTPPIPFWPLLFLNATIRLLGSDDFPPHAKRQAAEDINSWLQQARPPFDITTLPLDEIATAHEAVERRAIRGRIVLIPNGDGSEASRLGTTQTSRLSVQRANIGTCPEVPARDGRMLSRQIE